MSKQIRLQSSSEELSAREEVNLESLLMKLSIKALRSAETVLDEDVLSVLRNKYEEVSQQDKSAVSFLQFMVYSMLNTIDRLRQTFEMDVVQEDYQVLQQAAQRSQAEVRKHIRIEQQLKIYLDSLQEKVQDLQKKLAVEEQKYNQLFESMKQIDEERKELHLKVIRFEQLKGINIDEHRDKNKSQSNYTTINDQLYKDYFGGRKTKANKGRHVIDKINQRSRKLSNNQKSGGNLHFVDGSIQINLSNNIVVSKKGSYDQNLTKGQQVASHNSSIRELTKTVNMKQPAVQVDRRPNRKISKYKTETGEIEKRENRSNSVCN